MDKQFMNFKDKQGGDFAMYYYETLKGWRDIAMGWSDSDSFNDIYNSLKKYKIKNSELIDFINDFWSLDIRELTQEEYEQIKSVEEKYGNYSEESYETYNQIIDNRLKGE